MSGARQGLPRHIGAVAGLTIALAAGCGTDPGEAQSTGLDELPSPAGANSALPHLATGPDGQVVLSWLETNAGTSELKYSVLSDRGFSNAGTVATGSDWFVNWADFPSVTPLTSSTWAAHWLVKRPGGTYAYDIAMAMSTDAGATWGTPVTPHDDGTPTEHGFVSVFPWNGGAGAVWLDGRNMPGDGHGHDAPTGDARTILRIATVTPGGTVRDGRLVDNRVCDCCQTDAAMVGNGVVVAYRDRTTDEIRDIFVARIAPDSTATVAAVADDGWRIDGCPVNGPAIAAMGEAIAVAWFTAADGKPAVRLAFSGDGAASFDPPTDVDADRPIGRVDVEMLDDGSAVVSWLRNGAGEQAELCARRVFADGRTGEVRVIADVTGSRASGFPQLARHGDDLVFAWTDVMPDGSIVRVARVTVHEFE